MSRDELLEVSGWDPFRAVRDRQRAARGPGGLGERDDRLDADLGYVTAHSFRTRNLLPGHERGSQDAPT